MMKLSELFQTCRDLHYQEVEDSVNYQFVEEDSTLYIYFQCSNSDTDWKRNFDFVKALRKKNPYKDMKIPYKVHRGFLKCWKQVEDIVISKITELCSSSEEYKWKKIISIGYSHGAALCAFCHECVWYYRPDLRENGMCGIAFEAPRIYGGFFVKKELKERWSKFIVVRTNNDLVTHMPPILFGFSHVGTVWRITGNTELVKNNKLDCIKSHYPSVILDALNNSRGKVTQPVKDILKDLIDIR